MVEMTEIIQIRESLDSGAHGLAGGLLGETFNPPVTLSWEKGLAKGSSY